MGIANAPPILRTIQEKVPDRRSLSLARPEATNGTSRPNDDDGASDYRRNRAARHTVAFDGRTTIRSWTNDI